MMNLEKPINHSSQPKDFLLKGMVESYVDGILILTERGEWIQANHYARNVCTQLIQNQFQTKKFNRIPWPIWRVCEALIETQSMDVDQPVIIESEIANAQFPALRIRARWFKLDAIKPPYLLVILEDRRRSTQYLALTEADQYGLTPREAEVWLLRRANRPCKEIAAELFISLNTVKKHIKSILAKQKMAAHT
ncbi:MAG: helix-turn-helix transcriptional regulator [Pseudanabaenales cyanobacterium]|nr:helix-turn-helix transcriptional regulator [Pseudanabaenales cyanobacterium]